MKKINITKELKIALFTITILVGAFLLINFLKGKDIFNPTNNFYVKYKSVEGLIELQPVYMLGYKVGIVDQIAYESRSKEFIVTLSIDSDFSIPKSSAAEIYSSDILGSKSIRINPGDGYEYLKNRDTLNASLDLGIISNLSTQIIPLKDSVSRLISEINVTFKNVNTLLNEENIKELSLSFKELHTTLNNLNSISQNLEKSNTQITSTLSNLETLTSSLKNQSPNIENTIENLKDLSDSLKSADLKGTVLSLRNLLIEVNNAEGTIGKLIKTDSLHNQVNTLLRNVDLLINNINKNPKKYIKVSVF